VRSNDDDDDPVNPPVLGLYLSVSLLLLAAAPPVALVEEGKVLGRWLLKVLGRCEPTSDEELLDAGGQ
jgi:hypothetical protein